MFVAYLFGYINSYASKDLPFKGASLLLQSSDLAASKIVVFTIYKGKIAQKSGVAPLLTKYILENQSLQFKNNLKVHKLKVIKSLG